MGTTESLIISRDDDEVVIRFKDREIFRMAMDVSQSKTQWDLVSVLRVILLHASPEDGSKIIENGIAIGFPATELAELIRAELAVTVIEVIEHDLFDTGDHDGQKQLSDDFNSLVAEIEERAAQAGGALDQDFPASISYEYEDDPNSPFGIARADIYPWIGEDVSLYREEEMIGPWKNSPESTSRHLIFTRQVPKKVIHQAKNGNWDF